MEHVFMFDFDGCILDTMKKHGLLAADVMHRYFGMPKQQAVVCYHETTGIPFPKQLDVIFPNEPEAKRQACAQEYAKRKIEEVFNKAKPFQDVRPTFEQLHKRGEILVISSSTEAEMIQRLLQKFGLSRFVNHVFGFHEGTKLNHIDIIQQRYNPQTIVFVGDSGSDVKLNQHRANVVTVGRAGPRTSGMLSPKQLNEAGANIALHSLLMLTQVPDFSKYRQKHVSIHPAKPPKKPPIGPRRLNRPRAIKRMPKRKSR